MADGTMTKLFRSLRSSEKTRWFMRKGLSRINRMTVRVLGVKRTKIFLTKIYQKRTIDLENPRKLNEKLLASYYNSDQKQMAKLADKYEVRDYIREKELGEILVPVYGLYNSFDEINFGDFPERFVLKATHGCDMNYICLNRSKMDLNKLQKRVNFWLKTNIAYMSLELHYKEIRPRILCEQYLDAHGQITDYKFHCHNGQILFILTCTDRSGENFRNIYMPDWTHRPDAIINAKCNPEGVKKPEKLAMMLEIAEKLSDGFPFVRVDLYEVDGRVYFGELTFTPATGVMNHFTDDFLLEQGELWS